MIVYKIGLIDVDSHNFPNIPLMKISAFYKSMGSEVQFVHWNELSTGERISDFYNEVFISKIFTESVEPAWMLLCANVHRGGSGYAGIVTRVDQVGVYVLTNYWSSTEEDLFRIQTLRDIGFVPYVMIYDKQKFVDSHGNWLSGVADQYTKEELIHFKTCQHLQRWCNNRKLIKTCRFDEYE